MTYIHIHRPAEATGWWEERVDCTQKLVVSDDESSQVFFGSTLLSLGGFGWSHREAFGTFTFSRVQIGDIKDTLHG